MEPGKLCVIRQGPQGPYYNLQCRQHGKAVTHYFPRDQAQLVVAHTANFERSQVLVAQYVTLVATQTRAEREAGTKKRPCPGDPLAQDQEIQQLMARIEAATPDGVAVQQLEVPVRTAIFKPANALVGLPRDAGRCGSTPCRCHLR